MPDRDRIVRAALWGSAAYNGTVGLAFACPASVGHFFAIPLPAPRFYTTFLALFVLLFAGLYAWLARQPAIPKAFVAFAAIGKAGAFALTATLFALDEVSLLNVGGALGDLVFASIFAWWLLADGS